MGYSLTGVWRVLHGCGLGWNTARARLFGPDPDYRSKVRRLHCCLREAARPESCFGELGGKHPDLLNKD
ncbi:MAG: hypothetical protein JO189_18055 [Deltaproteobacteria bacterium]|nr:hypothetical protein [Deltaproteobacteria bacterium]